jgi:hypothetical protein
LKASRSGATCGTGTLNTSDTENETSDRTKLELATSLAEIYRENHEYELLAIHYETIGNHELRDRYIDRLLQEDQPDSKVIHYRTLQGKPELIPQEVIKRQLALYTDREDWFGRARLQLDIKNPREAAADYVRGIGEQLQKNNVFTAAIHLKELVEKGLIRELFVLAFEEAVDKDDLHWQIRALEELGWHSELRDLILRNPELEAPPEAQEAPVMPQDQEEKGPAPEEEKGPVPEEEEKGPWWRFWR